MKVADEVLSICTAFDFKVPRSRGHRSLWRRFCTYEGVFRIFAHMGVRCAILNIYIYCSCFSGPFGVGLVLRNRRKHPLLHRIFVDMRVFSEILRTWE